MLKLEDPVEAKEAKPKKSNQGGDCNWMSRLSSLEHRNCSLCLAQMMSEGQEFRLQHCPLLLVHFFGRQNPLNDGHPIEPLLHLGLGLLAGVHLLPLVAHPEFSLYFFPQSLKKCI